MQDYGESALTYSVSLILLLIHINNLFSDAKMVLECRSFTLSQQFTPKYKEPGNHNSGEDMLRTCKLGHIGLPLFKSFHEAIWFDIYCINM